MSMPRTSYKTLYEKMEVRAVGYERRANYAEKKLTELERENMMLKQQIRELKRDRLSQLSFFDEVA